MPPILTPGSAQSGTSGPWTEDQDAATHSLLNVAGITFNVDDTPLPQIIPLNEGGFDGSPGIELGADAGSVEFALRVGEIWSSDYAVIDLVCGDGNNAVTFSKTEAGQESTIGFDWGNGGAQYLLVADAAAGRNLRVSAQSAPGNFDHITSTGNVEGFVIRTQGAFPFDTPSPVGITIQDVPTEKIGFYGHAGVAQQTGVAVTAAGIHAALVALGLITA